MNSVNQLLHRVADPTLTHDERARLRCQLAKQLEEIGNYEAAREAMGELWRGVGHRPMLDSLDQDTTAEVLLRAGVLTGWIGSCKQIEGAQERAKDLISKSLTNFEALKNREKIIEAQTELAVCYWHEGAFNEARDLLKEAVVGIHNEESELKALTLSRLAMVERSANRLNDALRIHFEAAPLFEPSINHALKGRFHNEFGLVLKNLGIAERREDYIDRALIEFAAASFHFEQAGHSRYQAYVENNLGFLYGMIHKFSEAHEHLDRAQALFTSMKDQAHIAQVDDTRALVLLEEGRVTEAERLARAAVQSLEDGDQQFLFAEALITHGIALARLGRYQHARLTLQSAVEVAQNVGDPETAGRAALTMIEELGEHLTNDDLSITYQRATDLLVDSRDQATLLRLSIAASRVLFLTGVSPVPPDWKDFSLTKSMRRYEKGIIQRALKDAGGIVTRAARLLGQKHNTLIRKLNAKYPDLLPQRTPAKQRKRSLIFIHDEDKEIRPLVILHVEDEVMVADTVKELLETEGWTVETCREATSALKLLQGETHYDVLIFDNKLPDVSGVELIRRARRIPHRQHTPIIMLSGSDIEKEARRAGAMAFLKKPGDMHAIAETIARLLARKSKQKGK